MRFFFISEKYTLISAKQIQQVCSSNLKKFSVLFEKVLLQVYLTLKYYKRKEKYPLLVKEKYKRSVFDFKINSYLSNVNFLNY